MFQYIDSVYIGESVDYWNSSPEWWLLEVSGIPFGIFGDMIREGSPPNGCPSPNRWMGMVFGMTARIPSGNNTGQPGANRWSFDSVVEIWQLWDKFEIGDATMLGWWDRDCPVVASHSHVRATAYVRRDRTLIALASWSNTSTTVELLAA